MNFDMNAVWSRSVELMRDNFQLLLVIAGVFLLLPTIAMYLFIPNFDALIDPTSDPDQLAAQMGEMLGPVFLGFLLALVIQFGGYGAMVALMGDHRPTVGQAIGAGFKAVPSLFVVMVLFALAYVIGALVILVPLSLLAGVAGVPGLALVGIIPVLVFVAWLMARMSMTMPAMVLGGTLNPFNAIGESFKLTGPKQWLIVLFWVVIVAIITVISLLLSGIMGLVTSLLSTGATAMLLLGLISGAVGMANGIITCALAAAMYAQLTGPSTSAIEETFD